LAHWKTGQQIGAATNELIGAKAVFNLAPWEKRTTNRCSSIGGALP
jgi:hypothetical protein